MLRAAWKSLLARKVRLLLSIFAIVLGVAFVAGSLIFTDTLNRSFTAIFDSAVGDVVVAPKGAETEDGSPSTRTLPGSLVDELAGVDGAARADGRIQQVGVYVVGTDGKVVGGLGPPGFGANFREGPAARGLEGLSLVRGAAPEGDGEVAMDRLTAQRAGYTVGDTVRVVTPSPEAPIVQARLTGLLDYPDGGSTNGASFTVFDTPTAQQLFFGGRDEFSSIWVTAADGVSQSALRDAARQVLPSDVRAQTGDDAADQMAAGILEAISFITVFLLVFAGIALVVGSFLIVNTFSMLLAQRSRELALLRALGASRQQVTRSVLAEATVLGLVGGTLGLGLGVLLAIGIRALFGRFGLDLSGQSLVITARTPLAAYAVGVVVTLVAAYFPARRASRVPPVSALRDEVAMPASSLRRRVVLGLGAALLGVAAMVVGLFADPPGGGVWWVGLGILATLLGVAAATPVLARPVLALAALGYRRLFGSVGRLAGENARRNPRRTAATASALMIGLALVSTMAIAGASAKASVDRTIESNFAGDAVVSNVFGTAFSPSVATDAESLPEVGSVARLRWGFGRIEGRREGVAGVDPAAVTDLVRVDMTSGSFDGLRDGTVVVDESTAEQRGLTVGDEVPFRTPEGVDRLRVVGTFAENPILIFPYVTTLGTLADEGFAEADNFVIVDAAPGVGQKALLAALTDLTADLPTVSVKDQAGFAAEQRGPIDQLLALVYALLGLALVIAVLGVVNTLVLSIVERTREVGLLRAVGVSRRQLRSMVALEAAALSVVGGLLGVGMGVLFGVVLMLSLRDQGLEVLSVPVVQLLGFVVVSVVVGLLASVLPARRAARLDVLRAIATE